MPHSGCLNQAYRPPHASRTQQRLAGAAKATWAAGAGLRCIRSETDVKWTGTLRLGQFSEVPESGTRLGTPLLIIGSACEIACEHKRIGIKIKGLDRDSLSRCQRQLSGCLQQSAAARCATVRPAPDSVIYILIGILLSRRSWLEAAPGLNRPVLTFASPANAKLALSKKVCHTHSNEGL